jgi:hypothetical protein
VRRLLGTAGFGAFESLILPVLIWLDSSSVRVRERIASSRPIETNLYVYFNLISSALQAKVLRGLIA